MNADAKKDRTQGIVPGKVTYRLTKPHYRKGRYYKAGETITVEDEKPAKNWVKVDEAEAAPAPSTPSTSGTFASKAPKRASDREV